MANQSAYEIYQRSSLGKALVDSLDELVLEGRIEPQTARKVLANFDKSIAEFLAQRVQARMSFKGHLKTYNFCDDVWQFTMTDVNFKLDNKSNVHADKIRLVCLLSKRIGE